jgi:hypothetical protein
MELAKIFMKKGHDDYARTLIGLTLKNTAQVKEEPSEQQAS